MSGFSDWISDNKGKFISAVIAICYLLIFLIGILFKECQIEDLLKLAGFLIVPLACIWFGENMGGYTGFSQPGGLRITQTSPGCLISLLGWILLLLPLILGFISIFRKG